MNTTNRRRAVKPAPDSREFLTRARDLKAKLDALAGPYWEAHREYGRHISQYSFLRPDGTLIGGVHLIHEDEARNGA